MITIPVTISATNVTIPVDMSVETVAIPVGISGGIFVQGPYYEGEYEVTPQAWDETTLPTAGKAMLDDVTVKIIPMFETHNPTGTTIYIASEV